MQFKDIVMKRYAVKKFNGKAVQQEKIDELMELIRFAPTSFNLQPYKIKVITDSELKKKLEPASWNQPQITTCSHLLVFCANTDVKRLIDNLEKLMVDNGSNKGKIAPYIQIMRDFEANQDEDQKLIWAAKQCYIALGNAMNGATSLGLDTCPMEGFDKDAYKEILNLDKNLHPMVLCPIGYPDDEPRQKLRFEKNQIFF